MIIQKTQLYKILSAQTRGKADSKRWREFLNIFADTIFSKVGDGDTVYAPMGKFELRECKRNVGGFGNENPAYEIRREIKFTPAEKYKGLLND